MLIYMSIVVLKNKSRSNPRFAPISGRGKDGFSLNGGYRNIGAVGQFRMISNTTRTPFRGTHPMGNGGKYGAYYDKPLEFNYDYINDPPQTYTLRKSLPMQRWTLPLTTYNNNMTINTLK